MTPYQKHLSEWKNCQRCNLCERRIHVCLARGKIPCDVLFVGEAPGESENVIGKPFCGPAGQLLDKMIELSGLSERRVLITNLIACIPKLPPPIIVDPRSKHDVDLMKSKDWMDPSGLFRSGLGKRTAANQYIEWVLTQERLLKRLIALSGKRVGCSPGVGEALIRCFKRIYGGKIHEPPHYAIRACEPRLKELVAIAKPRKLVLVGKHAQSYVPTYFPEIPSVEILHPAAILRAPQVQQGLLIQRTTIDLSELAQELT